MTGKDRVISNKGMAGQQTGPDTGEPRSKAHRPEQVSVLEQGWWKRLSDAVGPDETAKAWAPLMFAMTKEFETPAESCVVFILDAASGQLRMAAHWPENRLPGNALLVAGETAVEQGRGVVRGALPDESPTDAPEEGGLVSIITPLMVEGKVLGAVGMEMRPARQTAMVAAMRRLQWGAAWMRDVLRADVGRQEAARYTQAVNALHVVVGVAEREDFATSARAAATDLANRFQCDRVSIGFRRLGRSRISAISNSAQFGKRMNLVQMLCAAMDEAIDQRSVILFPAEEVGEIYAVHRHDILARGHGAAHILTVPLFAVDRYVGSIVFERPAGCPFSQEDAEVMEAVSTVLAPVLDEKRRNDRWLITKASEAAWNQLQRLLGPGRLARKTVAIALVALVAFFWFARTEYRVVADAVVEGEVQRAIVVAFDGFVAEAPVRAGDKVAKGDLLARFDDRDLTLERLRLVTLKDRQKFEFDRAVAERDRAETRIRQTQIAQAESQIGLIDEKLARTQLLAPFDGLVVAGDLSQSIGSAVARGDQLFTVAPLDAYRVTLFVDERRIADVKAGQTGSLLVTALPDEPYQMRVEKITPVAEYAEGVTTFRVEASLTGETKDLRPGMEGVAKVNVDERRLIAIWTEPIIDWFRVWLWRWVRV
ncbi:putative efflux pump membrane fusion protein [Roseibium album]|nr:putative efflux pump membrane fusion protein [Roseibium album]